MTPKPATKSREEIVEALLRQLQSDARANLPGPPAPFQVEIGNELLRPMARDVVASGARYLIVNHGKAIMCLKCGIVSHNPNDLAQRYCGACHVLLGQEPA